MYFAEPVLFEIPVRPRVKKFIQAKLRDEAGRPQPLLVSADNEGAALMLWLLAQPEKVMLQLGWRRKPGQLDGETDSAGRVIAPADCTERIGLGIQDFHRSRHQYLLNYAELEVFNNFVDYVIENEFLQFCADNQDVSMIASIRQFCDRYDFSPDDINEETLRTTLKRHRKGTLTVSYDARTARQIHFRPMEFSRLAA